MEIDHDNKFRKMIFWFVVYITSFVFLYILAVTFIPIPEKNVRFVDTAFGFLLGTVLAGGIAYLIGGNPDKKSSDKSSTINAEDNSTINIKPEE